MRFTKGHTINLGKMRVPDKICGFCGKSYRTKGMGNRQKFCSISCGSKSRPSGRKGKTNSLTHRQKIANSHKGSKSHLYIDGRASNHAYRVWQKNLWRARKLNAIGSHTFQEWENLKAQYNWICPSCKRKEPEIKLTQDHIIPLSKGGSENIENIQPLCKPCNLHKMIKVIKY